MVISLNFSFKKKSFRIISIKLTFIIEFKLGLWIFCSSIITLLKGEFSTSMFSLSKKFWLKFPSKEFFSSNVLLILLLIFKSFFFLVSF